MAQREEFGPGVKVSGLRKKMKKEILTIRRRLKNPNPTQEEIEEAVEALNFVSEAAMRSVSVDRVIHQAFLDMRKLHGESQAYSGFIGFASKNYASLDHSELENRYRWGSYDDDGEYITPSEDISESDILEHGRIDIAPSSELWDDLLFCLHVRLGIDDPGSHRHGSRLRDDIERREEELGSGLITRRAWWQPGRWH